MAMESVEAGYKQLGKDGSKVASRLEAVKQFLDKYLEKNTIDWLLEIGRVSVWLWAHLLGCFVIALVENASHSECYDACTDEILVESPAQMAVTDGSEARVCIFEECWPEGVASSANGLCAGVPGSRCWTFIDAIYYWAMSITLAGRDDVAAHSAAGKWIALALSPVALIAIARILDAIGKGPKKNKNSSLEERLKDLKECVAHSAAALALLHSRMNDRCACETCAG